MKTKKPLEVFHSEHAWAYPIALAIAPILLGEFLWKHRLAVLAVGAVATIWWFYWL